MTLVVAVAYGGRWDIAARRAGACASLRSGEMTTRRHRRGRASARQLALAGLPDPDLLIRTGGEQRISNFLLWNLAYTELYFCDVLWPDFGERELDAAIEHFGRRQRRFGLTPGPGRVALMLRQRVITALVLAALVLLVILWSPHAAHRGGRCAAGARRRVGMVGVPGLHATFSAPRLCSADCAVHRSGMDIRRRAFRTRCCYARAYSGGSWRSCGLRRRRLP